MVTGDTCLTLLFCCVAQLDAPAIRPHCAHTVDTTGRFIAIIRNDVHGYDRMRLTVFEHLSEVRIVRRLHDTTLANKNVPGVRMLSGDGRFLVTVDEFGDRGMGPGGKSRNAIIIY